MVIFALKAPAFNVSKFEVNGNRYYTDDEIANMGNCNLGVNIFTGVDCGDIRDRLMRDPYMARVNVRRKLPSTVTIKITERVQTAGIVYGESFVVIDEEGIVLRKTTVDPKVTILRGLNISGMTLGEPIKVDEEVLLRQCMEIITSMQENTMYFKSITISEGEAKAYVLDTLMVRGVPDNILTALENKDIQLVVQELFNKGIETGTIKVNGDNYVYFTPVLES
jgi:cell division protein FtsQ